MLSFILLQSAQMKTTDPVASSGIVFAIYVPIIILLVLIIVLLAFLLRKFTLNSGWTKSKPNPFEKETLGLPPGTIRGVLTIVLLFAVVIIEAATLQTSGMEDNFKSLTTAFSVLVAFYFGSKMVNHASETERIKVQAKYSSTNTQVANNNESASTTSEAAPETTTETTTDTTPETTPGNTGTGFKDQEATG